MNHEKYMKKTKVDIPVMNLMKVQYLTAIFYWLTGWYRCFAARPGVKFFLVLFLLQQNLEDKS